MSERWWGKEGQKQVEHKFWDMHTLHPGGRNKARLPFLQKIVMMYAFVVVCCWWWWCLLCRWYLFCLRIFRHINASQVIQDCASIECMHVLLRRTLISLLLAALGPIAAFERLTQYSGSSRQLAFACPEAMGNYYQKPWLETPCRQKTSPEQRRLW